MKKLIFLLLFLPSCKTQFQGFLELKSISPNRDKCVYRFGKIPYNFMLIDTPGAFEFPDTIFLIKKQDLWKN